MNIRRTTVAAPVLLLLAGLPASAQPPAPAVFSSLTSSSSRPASGTVVSTVVVRNGELALLVLWRGTPGWYYASAKGSSGGGGGSQGGRETGFEQMSYGGRSFLIEFDYTARTAKLLGQEISLAETNVVLVDDVDGARGARIVDRRRIDPVMPAPIRQVTLDGDPLIIAIRRDPALVAFIQCAIPMPFPPGVNTAAIDPATLAWMRDYMQTSMTLVCQP